jgi:hypothetical protein
MNNLREKINDGRLVASDFVVYFSDLQCSTGLLNVGGTDAEAEVEIVALVEVVAIAGIDG